MLSYFYAIQNSKQLIVYSELTKADSEIFDIVPNIPQGGTIIRGMYFNQIEAEAHYYKLNSNDSLVKKFLPGAFVENDADAVLKIINYKREFVQKKAIVFCIATLESKIPVGYIISNAPQKRIFLDDEDGLGEWSIDFWITSKARSRGIMKASLNNVLVYLTKMKVKLLFAYCSKQNTSAIKLLLKLGFSVVESTSNNEMFKLGVKLC